MIIKLFVVFLLIAYETIAFADECTGKYTKNIDVCSYAKTFSNDMAKQLPMQMDATMTLIKTFSYGNTWVMQTQFSYNEDYLKIISDELNLTKDQLIAFTIKSSKTGFCSGNDVNKRMLKWLIKEGMIVRYKYIYNDMTPAFEYEISHCE